MALKKLKTLPSGVTGDYWSIEGIRVDYSIKQASVNLSLHINEAAKKVSKNSPLFREGFNVILSGEAVRGDIYTLLKRLTEEVPSEEGITIKPGFFSDAEDV